MGVFKYGNIKSEQGALSRTFVSELRQAFRLQTFVETGTYLGDTVECLCEDFELLHSIELSPVYFEQASRRFTGRPKVHLTNADSTSGLAHVLASLGSDRVLVWLDAHFSGGDTAKGASNSPVESELRTILGFNARSDVILIDDLRYFWQTRSGFLKHEALLGYPSVRQIVELLNKDGDGYDCYALSDALLAVPCKLREQYTVSEVLRAITESRTGLDDPARIADNERTIASAGDKEADAILTIPGYLEGQSAYGLCGHYYYWRALVRLAHGDELGAAADAAMASKCGALPVESSLGRFVASMSA